MKKEPEEKEVVKEVDTLTMEALLKECDAMGEEEEDNLSEAELGRKRKMSGFPRAGKWPRSSLERRRYQSPCGRHFGGLADALAFLLEGGEGEEGIGCMTGGLALKAGSEWKAFPRLSGGAGWMQQAPGGFSPHRWTGCWG